MPGHRSNHIGDIYTDRVIGDPSPRRGCSLAIAWSMEMWMWVSFDSSSPCTEPYRYTVSLSPGESPSHAKSYMRIDMHLKPEFSPPHWHANAHHHAQAMPQLSATTTAQALAEMLSPGLLAALLSPERCTSSRRWIGRTTLPHTHTQRRRSAATGCGDARCLLLSFARASKAIEP